MNTEAVQIRAQIRATPIKISVCTCRKAVVQIQKEFPPHSRIQRLHLAIYPALEVFGCRFHVTVFLGHSLKLGAPLSVVIDEHRDSIRISTL